MADAFEFDTLKFEKATAMLRFHRLQKITKLFRFLELCLVLVLISWSSTHLSFAVKISGDYFRRLLAVAVSPTFIFFLSNAIVVTLFLKSGQFSSETPINNADTESDLCGGFIRNADFPPESSTPPIVPVPEEIVFEDKQVVSELSGGSAMEVERKRFRRTQSENLEREVGLVKVGGKLRRSDTEKCVKSVCSGEFAAATAGLFEEMSNEEFQRRIEEFIAKQVKFHKEEKMIIVPHNHP